MNFRDHSFQVAKTYQLSIKAATSNIAHAHPTRLGKKTAVPSFCGNCVCTSMNREREPPTAKKATATHSFTCPSPARQIEPAPQPPASTIPKPKSRPPIRPPAQKPAKTQSVASFRS